MFRIIVVCCFEICYTKIGQFVIYISWINRSHCYLKLTMILDAVVLCNVRQAIRFNIIINKRCIHSIRKCSPIFPLHFIHLVNIKFLSGPKPKSKMNLLCGFWHCNISSCYMRKQSNNKYEKRIIHIYPNICDYTFIILRSKVWISWIAKHF